MLRRFETKELIQAESQQIAKIDIDSGWAQATDPEIEQTQVAQHTVE